MIGHGRLRRGGTAGEARGSCGKSFSCYFSLSRTPCTCAHANQHTHTHTHTYTYILFLSHCLSVSIIIAFLLSISISPKFSLSVSPPLSPSLSKCKSLFMPLHSSRCRGFRMGRHRAICMACASVESVSVALSRCVNRWDFFSHPFPSRSLFFFTLFLFFYNEIMSEAYLHTKPRRVSPHMHNHVSSKRLIYISPELRCGGTFSFFFSSSSPSLSLALSSLSPLTYPSFYLVPLQLFFFLHMFVKLSTYLLCLSIYLL